MNLQDFHLLLIHFYITVSALPTLHPTYIFSISFHTGLREPLIVLVFIFWLPELFSGINLTCERNSFYKEIRDQNFDFKN